MPPSPPWTLRRHLSGLRALRRLRRALLAATVLLGDAAVRAGGEGAARRRRAQGSGQANVMRVQLWKMSSPGPEPTHQPTDVLEHLV